MKIRDMRKRIGMTQRAFAEKYHIPLQTLKQWESEPNSSSHRKPTEYVTHMLERLIEMDYGVHFGSLSRTENLIVAASHSKDSLRQWLRYLGKEFTNRTHGLTEDEINAILCSEELSKVQKIAFEEAIKDGTPINKYVVSLEERAKTPMVDELLKGIDR